MTSLRGTLTRWLLSATILLSCAAGIALYVSMREALLEQFDSGLTVRAHAIGSTLRVERNGRYEMDFADESMKEYLPGKHAEYFQILRPDGSTMELSESLEHKPLLDPATIPADGRAWNLTLPSGRAGRAITYSIVPASEDEDRDQHPTTKTARAQARPLLVIVARGRGSIDEVLNALLTAMIVTAAILNIVGVLAVRLAIARGLRPVSNLSAQANSIGPDTLEYRFDVESLPQELQPICVRLNDLLERLDNAFKRERRINADIAHELRTPIAELRSLTEVAERWPGDAKQTSTYFRDAHEIGLRMESMVEALLALARSQTRKPNIRVERIDLGALLSQIRDVLQAKIESRALEFICSIPEVFVLDTDRVLFRRILENLIDNAVHYAPTGGKVQCSATQTGTNRAVITIANANDSLTPDDLSNMFEPFWRKDAARSGDSHAGLGLALVAEYARQLNITVAQKLLGNDWFEVTLAVECAASQAVCDPTARVEI